jgi:hypothetical protein
MIYKNGDIVKFRFRSSSGDLEGDEVLLIGEVYVLLWWKNTYIVKLSDKKKEIYGEFRVPKEKIIGKVKD